MEIFKKIDIFKKKNFCCIAYWFIMWSVDCTDYGLGHMQPTSHKFCMPVLME
jgi:hypothetical protein